MAKHTPRPESRPEDSSNPSSHEPTLINVGCGNTFHHQWINLDIAPRHPSVIQHDINENLPFQDNSVDFLYNSHVLEHLDRKQALNFTKECFRVLKTTGILRVVIPDLETIAKLYLKYLKKAEEGCAAGEARYDCMVLELVDQLTRHEPGGEMLRHWQQPNIKEKDFIIERLGEEARPHLREKPTTGNSSNEQPNETKIGAFRLSGEVHRWMYDKFSLARLLKSVGFKNVDSLPADQSHLQNWHSYLLDTTKEGTTRKPDSLFMEARK